MAEGFSRTIEAGSDAEMEIPCTSCEEDGVTNGAVSYCPTCDQYFCKACLKYHARFPSTKGHTVSGVHTKRKHGTEVVSAKCLTHPDRNIEMYCGQHDMVYCALCVATDHRTCTGVKEVTDAKKPKINHSKRQDLIGKIDTLQTKFQESTKRKGGNIKRLQEREKEDVEEIEDSRKLLIQHINELHKKALASLNNTHEELVKQIKKEITQATDMEKSLQKYRGELASSESLTNSQRFVQQILGQKTVANAEDLLSNLNSYEIKQIEIDVNKRLRDTVLNAKYTAKVNEKTVHSDVRSGDPSKGKNVMEIYVGVPDDTDTCIITGITQLPDGTIIICDLNNRKLKRLDDQWKVRDYCYLDSKPWGVCCTGDNEVAVKMANDYVQFVSVGFSLSKTRKFKISGGAVLGMECLFGQLWVSGGSCINVYSLSESQVKRTLNPSGTFNNSTPQGLAGSGETIYVSGCKNQIVCLNKDGCLQACFADKSLGWSRGVCVVKDNIVCAAGYQSNNIVMFTKDGKCFGELVGVGQGIKKPWTLYYDKKGDKLIVGCDYSNMIKVLSF